jgi:hypothetical protein
MRNIQSQLQDIASSFAVAVLQAVRTASLQELQDSVRGNARNGRVSTSVDAPAHKPAAPRLSRRSQEDIAKQLARVVTLVKGHKGGVRAEQIRHELGMQSKEMPRILKEGLSSKALKSKGQKRATTYFAS